MAASPPWNRRPVCHHPAHPRPRRRRVLAAALLVGLCAAACPSLTAQAAVGDVTLYPVPNSGIPTIVSGPDGKLWFTDSGRVASITTSGVVTGYPTGGYPQGICAGPDGNLWFTQPSGGKISRITPSGTITDFSVPSPGASPWSIIAGPDGNLWFTEYYTDKIGRITPAGKVSEFPTPTPQSSPFSITAGPDGNLWFTEQAVNKVAKATTAGVITEYSVDSFAQYITSGPQGKLWFTQPNTNRVASITTDGGTIARYDIPTSNSIPQGIIAGPDDKLWFVEFNFPKIGSLTLAGNFGIFKEYAYPGGGDAMGIASGPDGRIWLGEWIGDHVGALMARPKVTGVSPRAALDTGGGTASVSGAGFTGATAVKFGNTSSGNVSVANDGALTASIPAHAPQVVHLAVTAGGSASLAATADRFCYYSSLGGGLTAAPDVSSWGGGRLDAFGRGPNGALWHRSRVGGQWNPWESLGGGLAPNTGVGAVSWAQNRIDVFVVGVDNGLYHKWWNGAAWSGWQQLGGSLSSGPDVASWAAGRLDVFARGQDNGLWHTWWDGAQWNSWHSLGGSLTSDPGAVSWAANRIDVFVRGVPNGLFHKWWDGVQWNDWEALGGTLNSGPDPAAPGVGVLDVFYQAPDGNIWGRAYTGGWQAPRSMYLAANAAPGAVASAPGASDLVARGAGNSLLYTNTPPG